MLNKKVEDVIRDMVDVAQSPDTPEPVQAWLGALVERLMDSETLDERYVKGSEIPVGIGPKADEYMVVRDHRLALEKEARSVKDRETEIFNSIMSTLDESTETGGVGKMYRVQRVEKDVTNVKDWDAVWKHIQKTGDFNLLQKRLNDKAAKEMIEGGDALPGVAMEKVATLSFNKNPSK